MTRLTDPTVDNEQHNQDHSVFVLFYLLVSFRFFTTSEVEDPQQNQDQFWLFSGQVTNFTMSMIHQEDQTNEDRIQVTRNKNSET